MGTAPRRLRRPTGGRGTETPNVRMSPTVGTEVPGRTRPTGTSPRATAASKRMAAGTAIAIPLRVKIGIIAGEIGTRRPKMDRRRRDRSAREVNEDVDRVAERIERRAERRKLDINDPHEARNLIKDILGRDSDVSRAEVVRESHGEHRRDLQRDRNREDIRSAADFLRRRLRGRADQENAPGFLHGPCARNAARDAAGNAPAIARIGARCAAGRR